MNRTGKPNRLINESSPYLLQHAYNPVDWYPWCEEAFEKARNENKPVFLSIGYSTCHWCHVMEKESFEDEEVAALMNDLVVAIKVDREERPDIDNIYMMVCQMMSGGGGWPLSVFMTPDKKPFFTGTYFPKETRYGRIGFKQLIKNISDAWQKRRDEIINSAGEIADYLQKIYKSDTDTEITEQILHEVYEHFLQRFDKIHGGFGSRPKFPSPHNLMFLLRYWDFSKKPEALEMVTKTLAGMRSGGIYDQIGFGFHRYSTDEKWLVPHFEKMLYDQALLILTYTEAFQATSDPLFKITAEETIEYLKRELRSQAGGFFSAEDADSEGQEGKFYIWTKEELIDAVGKENYSFVKTVFNISDEGNFVEEATREATGKNIICLAGDFEKLSDQLNITTEELKSKLSEIRRLLFESREKRIHPFKDDKILTDWNGLTIAALARAGNVFGNMEYIELAEACLKFIFGSMRDKNGNLLHVYRNGKAKINGSVDDYAFLIFGLLELYEATFDAQLIKDAEDLTAHLLKHFWDSRNFGFYFTADYSEQTITRTKEIYDGAIPSGNSVMFHNLIRLYMITAEPVYLQYSDKLLKNFSAGPAGYTFLLSALFFHFGKSYEIIICSNERAEVDKMKARLSGLFIPNKTIVLKSSSSSLPYGYLQNYSLPAEGIVIYVCKNFKCDLPVNSLEELQGKFE